jgi:hypothetical protein
MKNIYIVSLIILAFLISTWALDMEPYESKPAPVQKLPARYDMSLEDLTIEFPFPPDGMKRPMGLDK